MLKYNRVFKRVVKRALSVNFGSQSNHMRLIFLGLIFLFSISLHAQDSSKCVLGANITIYELPNFSESMIALSLDMGRSRVLFGAITYQANRLFEDPELSDPTQPTLYKAGRETAKFHGVGARYHYRLNEVQKRFDHSIFLKSEFGISKQYKVLPDPNNKFTQHVLDKSIYDGFEGTSQIFELTLGYAAKFNILKNLYIEAGVDFGLKSQENQYNFSDDTYDYSESSMDTENVMIFGSMGFLFD